MPGLTYYLICFKYEGFWYQWNTEMNAYYSNITLKKYEKPPAGFYANDDCWVSQWRDEDDY